MSLSEVSYSGTSDGSFRAVARGSWAQGHRDEWLTS